MLSQSALPSTPHVAPGCSVPCIFRASREKPVFQKILGYFFTDFAPKKNDTMPCSLLPPVQSLYCSDQNWDPERAFLWSYIHNRHHLTNYIREDVSNTYMDFQLFGTRLGRIITLPTKLADQSIRHLHIAHWEWISVLIVMHASTIFLRMVFFWNHSMAGIRTHPPRIVCCWKSV